MTFNKENGKLQNPRKADLPSCDGGKREKGKKKLLLRLLQRPLTNVSCLSGLLLVCAVESFAREYAQAPCLRIARAKRNKNSNKKRCR
jgi:hypothetical protein